MNIKHPVSFSITKGAATQKHSALKIKRWSGKKQKRGKILIRYFRLE